MLYGYARASKDKQTESPETQRHLIESFMKARGLEIDGWFIDPASCGDKSLWERKAGAELINRLRHGDSIVVLRLDRLSRSFINFARILELLEAKSVTLYMTDFAGGCFQPDNPMSALMIHVLIAFANYERKMISVRTKEGLAERKAKGQRHCGDAPFGYEWEPRWDHRRKKRVFMKVVCHREQAIMRRCLELRATGMSYEAIYQEFRWGKEPLRNRKGQPFTADSIRTITLLALKNMAHQETVSLPEVQAMEEEEDSDEHETLTKDDNNGKSNVDRLRDSQLHT